MAEDVQRLLLQIDANATLLRQEMSKARSDIDGFAKNTERSVSQATGALDLMTAGLKGAVAAMSIQAVVGFSKSILNFADDLGTAADQAGIAVVRFQTLREGLRALEVDTVASEKIFKQLLTTLGEVQTGEAAKGVTETLDRMGIKTKILNGEISTTDQFIDAIARASKNYTTEAQFAADVTALVGQRLGPQLAAALKDGGLALSQAEAQFTSTGAVIDEQLIQKLADANERIDAFTSSTKNKVVIWAGTLIEALDRLGNAWENVFGPDTSTREGAMTAAMQARSDLVMKKSGQGFFPFATSVYENRVRMAEENQRRIEFGMERANSASFDPMTRMFPLRSLGAGKKIPIGGTPKPSKAKTAKTAKDFTAANMESGFELRQLLDAGTPANIELTNEALQGVAETMRDLQQYDFSLDLVDRQQIELAQAYTETLTTGLAQAIVYGRSFGDVLKGLAAQILSAGLLNIISGGAFGVAFGSSLGGLGKVFGGARANGGPVSMGKSYLVGERGPELFVPQASGYINPNASGGGTGNQQQVRVMVEPSPLFVTTVVQGATAAAGEQMRKAARPRMMMSAGA